MTRILILITAIGSVSACAQYRAPKASCFNLVSRGPTSVECDFTPLTGSETMDDGYD